MVINVNSMIRLLRLLLFRNRKSDSTCGKLLMELLPVPHVSLMMRICISLLLTVLAAGAAQTPRKTVVNEYQGVRIKDDYQWLENATDPKVSKWTADQNRTAREYLDKLPTRASLTYEFGKLFSAVSADYSGIVVRSNRIFAMKFKPPAQQAILVRMHSLQETNTEKVVLDPNTLDPQGGTGIDFFEPSIDGRMVAVSLSEKGSEAGTVYVYEVSPGRKLPDVVPRVQLPTAGGSVAWNADGTGFYYTRYPAPGERPEKDLRFYQQVYFHQLGTPTEKDRYEIGHEFPRIAETDLKTSLDGRYLLATVSNGDGGDYAHYLRTPSGQWRQITRYEDQIKQVEFGRDPLYIEWPKDDSLYLLSRKDAPRGKILKISLNNPDLASATEVIKQRPKVISGFVPAASGLYLHFLDGGPSELRCHDLYAEGEPDPSLDDPEPEGERGGERNRDRGGGRRDGSRDGQKPTAKEWKISLTGLSSIEQMVCSRGDELLFRTSTYTAPYTWQSYDPNKNRERASSTQVKGVSPADFQDVEAVRRFVISKDGTKIPLNIIRRKGARTAGDTPTILYGYGGYGISMTPHFSFTRRVWLDQGGMYAIANLRGGGEYGEEWHKAGNLTRKQNVFDDFIACAEFLVRSNYTRPDRLAIEGGSNGGLLMGAALTQRSDLFRAVVSHVGIYDMLRVELDPNGEFNTTEFGTVKIPEQFRALYAYSPYHHVADKAKYPAVLLLTGEHDGRVNPAHSRKMTARIQAANASKNPVLLRTSGSSGHGIGTALNERVAQLVDVYSFLFQQLGFDYSLVARGPWAGAVTPNSAVVKARLAREGLAARLALSPNPLLTSAKFNPPLRTSSNNYYLATFPLDGLKPDTTYHYALEVDGKLDRTKRGQFRTFPAGPASFSFAYASCAQTASTSDIFDTIRDNKPLFYMNIGDFHYQNLTNADVMKFRAAYDLVLTSPEQSDLYRSTPFFYVYDDHDYGGNNSSRKATSHNAARSAYAEYVPHYPLAGAPGADPIYQTFSVGRVKFIVTDLRSERDDPKKNEDADKTMMGEKQKQWFKQELLSANGKYPLIFWVSSVPWLGVRGSNYYKVPTNYYGFVHHTNFPGTVSTNRPGRSRGAQPGADEDHWSAFATERREICDFVVSNHIEGLAILHGDAHMLGADDGSNSDFSTHGGFRVPVMCGAPLDQTSSIKGGPYSQGVYKVKRNEGGFGFVTVNDLGDHIDVRYSGRNNRNEEKISLQFSVRAGPKPIIETRTSR